MDYGNVPQWLALIVGAVVAGYTVLGIRTARRAYRDDVRIREFAQARLVYAEIQQHSGHSGPTNALVSGENTSVHLDPELTDKVEVDRSRGPKVSMTVKIPDGLTVSIYVLRVHNNSDELISEVRAQVMNEERSRMFAVKSFPRARTVSPQASIDFVIIHPVIDSSMDEAAVGFRDASGKYWRRIGAHPVEKSDSASIAF